MTIKNILPVALFVLFGIFEGLVSYLYFTATPEMIMETHTGMVMSESAMRITRGFACALAAITVMSFLTAFYVKESKGIVALSAGFFTYNATVLYYCINPGFETDFYERSVFIHGTFAALFALNIIVTLLRAESPAVEG